LLPGEAATASPGLVCKPEIGDKINTRIIQPLIDANRRRGRLPVFASVANTNNSR
jgi:hypothetical protein